ncbi:MAG: substrate-binding domain-containing protein [Flavobacterium sp.]|nr:substrate-binding domain-containing protein [Flavobacterium sp.]
MKKFNTKVHSSLLASMFFIFVLVNLGTFKSYGMVTKSSVSADLKSSQHNKESVIVESKETLKLAVATTVKVLMKLVEPAFEPVNKNTKITSTIGPTGDMVELVMAGKSKVAITTRNLKDYEKVKCPTLVGTPIGLDGLAIVVSSSNPVSNLAFAQISAIWTGKIVNWKELGGPDLPIVLIGRTKAYDSIMLFCDFMKLESKPVEGGLIYREKGKEDWCSTVITAPETDDLALTILLKTPGAITYFPLQVLNNYKEYKIAVKCLSFDGVQPTKETIANGTYFIHRTLNAITNGQPEGLTKTFVDFLVSMKGQELIVEAGFLSL